VGEAPKLPGRRGRVAKRDQRVLSHRVRNKVQSHGRNYTPAVLSRISRMVRGAVLAVALALVVAMLMWQTAVPGARVDLVISGGTVVTMDVENTVIADGAVAIDDGTIVAVGGTDEIAARYAGAERVDARGQIILPGLINTHGHAPMVMYRGLADDMALMDWLNQYIFPAEKATVSPEFVRIGTQLAALEMIESGTTTFADMYYFEEVIAPPPKRPWFAPRRF
jgi:hypothetical protein